MFIPVINPRLILSSLCHHDINLDYNIKMILKFTIIIDDIFLTIVVRNYL